MKIKTLIEILQRYDPETSVVVEGFESGYNNIKGVELVRVVRNSEKTRLGKSWEGDFEDADEPDAGTCRLVIRR